MRRGNPLISIVVPVYNEAANLPELHRQIQAALAALPYDYELIFVDDGSTDSSVITLNLIQNHDPFVRIIEFSRNFGKEIATTAGLHASRGAAAIMIDADLQHPPQLIPEFLTKWQAGAEVVVGVRRSTHGQSLLSRLNSWLFYKIMNSMSETKVTPGSTDYRLLDRAVLDEFNRFTERNRFTRGLIDWLGFRRQNIYFAAAKRAHGKANYSTRALIRLALDSFISLSLFPLKVAGYVGIIITALSGPLGIFIFVEKYLIHDPLGLAFSGPAILAVILVFLIGIVLMSLGLIALYIANIHSEVINRPMYVVRRSRERVASRTEV